MSRNQARINMCLKRSPKAYLRGPNTLDVLCHSSGESAKHDSHCYVLNMQQAMGKHSSFKRNAGLLTNAFGECVKHMRDCWQMLPVFNIAALYLTQHEIWTQQNDCAAHRVAVVNILLLSCLQGCCGAESARAVFWYVVNAMQKSNTYKPYSYKQVKLEHWWRWGTLRTWDVQGRPFIKKAWHLDWPSRLSSHSIRQQ